MVETVRARKPPERRTYTVNAFVIFHGFAWLHMESPRGKKIFREGSGHVDTVGVTGSNPVSRTIQKRNRRVVQKCVCVRGRKLRYESTAYPIISLVI